MQRTVRNMQFAYTMRCNDRDVDYLNRVNVIFIFISRKRQNIETSIRVSLRFNFADYRLYSWSRVIVKIRELNTFPRHRNILTSNSV